MDNFLSRVKYLTVFSICVFLYASLCVASKAHSANSVDLPIVFQQQVTGVVTDNNGLPIPGVAVRVLDSSSGTVTNTDGVYSLSVASDATLIFTYMGFETSEVMVDGRREINVRLVEDVEALGEVQINAGYYHTSRRESTGNISRVTSEEIELQPVVSPLQALQGRMAGVEIIPRGNHPGSASTIRIRGTNSLREEGNYPMYIIDGVPVNSTPIESNSALGGAGIDPLSIMNLSNIESIEILKDADATAIYGSRGANGVVLITTKRAREGRIELQTRVYTGVSDVPNRVDMMDTQQYLEIRKRAFANSGEEITERSAYDLLLWNQNRNTDWQDVLFGGTSPFTDINLTVSGGNENNNFRLSGSYNRQGTVYIGDYDYNRVTASLQAHHSSKDKKFNLDLSVNFGVTTNNNTGFISLTSSAFSLPPNAPKLFNEDGSLHWQDWSAANLKNPMEGYFNSSNTIGENLNSNLIINYELFSGLSFRTNLGYTTYNGHEVVKEPLRSFNPGELLGLENRSTHMQTNNNSWIVEPQLIFNKQIGKNYFETLIGGTFQERESASLSLRGTGYVSEAIIGNLHAADLIDAISDQKSEYRYSAIFARLGYNWGKKYFINLTGRRDGSSRFGHGKRVSNFGAVGAAWIFSEEPLLKENFPILSFGKLRGSYGTTGNDQIGDYQYLDAYEVTRAPGGLYPNQLANPDYSWEENKKLELGMELGFLQDRLNLGLSWFQNRSSNQLVGYPLPALTGFNTVQANLPATVENTGWELEMSTYNIQNKDFNWQTSLNFTLPKNRLVAYPDIEQSSYATTYKIGHPLSILFLYQYTGLDPETGFYTVKDANDDGSIDWEDRTVIWDRGREFFGGISNSLSYKKISLQFLFQFVKQEGRITQFKAGFINPLPVYLYDELNQGGKYQKVSNSLAASQAYSNTFSSTFPLVDASYIKLKSLNLNYSLPDLLLRNMGLQSGKIFITGQNLLTFTKFKGLDPEQPIGGTSFGGLRTITTGIQLTL